jgi:hypothetical protein
MTEVEKVLKRLGYKVAIEVPPKPKHKGNNMFYWWRRFPTHKPLHKNKPLEEKIANGDYNYSPYWDQIQYEYQYLAEALVQAQKQKEWCNEKEREIRTVYNKRITKLSEDAMKDEHNRFESFKTDLKACYGGFKDEVDEFVNTFEGSLAECAIFYKLSKKFK